MRVGVVDVGTNSTRLLIADVEGGRVTERVRESIVTRLGEGLERSGKLARAGRDRVFAVLDRYRDALDAHGCAARRVVLTSAVRDAADGEAFTAAVRSRYGLDGGTISGDEEARLTFLGATAGRAGEERLAVVDIGGGSTEVVAGRRGEVSFHVSTQVGVVRHTERHLHGDPPPPDELRALAADATTVLFCALEGVVRDRERPRELIAVAGTPTSAAAIDLGGWDREAVEGHVLSRRFVAQLLDRLASMPLAERRQVPGLHPDRAPVIVAGLVILLAVIDALDLGEVTVSERDILWGVAIDAASPSRP